jgi:hypothetical protein
MGGGLMQLVAYGAQDIYLTGNPQITFFKVVYRRHTNFSVESIEQTFNGTPGFGKKVSATIARNGDLVHRVLLEVIIPKVNRPSTSAPQRFGFFDHLGERLLKYIDIEIGGQRIDRHYGEWLHIWNQLTLPESQKSGYLQMIGHTPKNINPGDVDIEQQTLYIPLQFWFCRNPGLALPLIALQYHEVKINIEFEDVANVMFYELTSNQFDPPSPTELSISSSSLWVDYIYLDTDERRRFAQLSHEYLIEQLQYPGEETITVTSNKIKLAFNHPVKELVWVVQNTDIRDIYKQMFNYTTVVDKTPISSSYGSGNIMQELIAQSMMTYATGTPAALVNNIGYKPGYKDTGKNTVDKAKLQLNGQDRFAERAGTYFNLVVPHFHHTSIPKTGINVYSFGLKPEEHQPSGTCNFSRIDNANLFLTVETETIKSIPVTTPTAVYPWIEAVPSSSNNKSAKVRVYAVNYNVLRIMSGMGGLAYSN